MLDRVRPSLADKLHRVSGWNCQTENYATETEKRKWKKLTSKKTMVEYAKLKKRPQYFNLFYESCEALSMLDNNSAGKVIHAIADYFIDGIVEKELANFSKSERRCYERIKRGIDDSVEAWTTRVENGRTGAKSRWS